MGGLVPNFGKKAWIWLIVAVRSSTRSSRTRRRLLPCKLASCQQRYHLAACELLTKHPPARPILTVQVKKLCLPRSMPISATSLIPLQQADAGRLSLRLAEEFRMRLA